MKKIATGMYLIAFMLGLFLSCKHEAEPLPVRQICFDEEIMPLVRSNCASNAGCHSSVNPANGLILDSYGSILASGTVEPFNANGSELYEVLLKSEVDERMPYMQPPLSADKIALISTWINQGALNIPCTTPCDTDNVTFSNQVMRVLQGNCMGNCHGGSTPSSGISLQGYAQVKLVADNGTLIKAINHMDSLNVKPMPYPVGSSKMSPCNIRVIEKWIENGALNN